ncbi:MAG: methyl-accepting chemotaxis protein, partial [Marinobacter sp.]|nr:methyl-accepting chemotaxis protein [Marinobacter sp.]
MQLTFGQKLLIAFGILLVLVMGASTWSGNLRLQNTTETYVEALIEEAVAQSSSSIADWLNTRLTITESTASAMEELRTDRQAMVLLRSSTSGGGFRDVYVGRDDGYMLMKTAEDNEGLPADYDPRTRPWYQTAVSLGQASFTEPYRDVITGDFIISTFAPVNAGAYRGVIGGDIGLGTIQNILAEVTLAGTGYASLITADGTVLFHPDEALIGENVSNLIGKQPDLDGSAHTYSADDQQWTASFHAISDARGVDWYLGTFVNDDEIHAPVAAARITGIIIALVGLAISLLVLHVGIRVLMAPVRKLNLAMENIATGDADLTRRLDDSSEDEFGRLAGSFNSFVENIRSVVSDVQQGTGELKENVTALRQTASTSRASVENQQTEIDMVATAINEMSAAAGEIAQSAQQTADAANMADGDSRASLETVKASREAVQKLSHEI